jgi:hypothetical protein
LNVVDPQPLLVKGRFVLAFVLGSNVLLGNLVLCVCVCFVGWVSGGREEEEDDEKERLGGTHLSYLQAHDFLIKLARHDG